METKFTQDEWKIRPTRALNENGNPLYYDITVGGRGILSTYKNQFIEGMGDEMQLANAKLAVAAPEMFAILKSLSIVNHEIPEWLTDEIQQLLTKITQ